MLKMLLPRTPYVDWLQMNFIERNWELLERRLKELGISVSDCAVKPGHTPNCVHVEPHDGGHIIFLGVGLALLYRRR